jgi:integrase
VSGTRAGDSVVDGLGVSHATALLLSGVPVHVVSRRLGHADVQTTLNTYAHVTEDAELRTVGIKHSWRRNPASNPAE